MDKTFHTGHDLHKSAVVSDDDHFTFDLVTNLQIGIEFLPRLRSELFETQGDTFLTFFEVEDNDVDLLVELNHFGRMVDTAPREVGDVDKAVQTAEIDECTVRNNVLDSTFEDLSDFEFADDFSFLSFDFSLDEGLVGNDDILVVVVDLHNLELHGLADIDVKVADLLHINLRTRQEGFDTENVHDETAFGLTLHIAGDNFLIVVCFVDTLP